MNHNILIIDDQTLFSEAVKEALQNDYRYNCIRSASCLKEAIQEIEHEKPNIILLDLNLGNQSGFNILSYIQHSENKKLHDIKVIILSVRSDSVAINKAIKLQAKAYLDKTCHIKELKEAIDTVAHGGEYYSERVRQSIIESKEIDQTFNEDMLSIREKEVLGFLCDSLTSKQIASQLNISHNTVNIYRKKLLNKFGVSNTSGLVKVALQTGIIG